MADRKYRTFLSHSRKDRQAAERLQKALNEYRLPASLSGRQTPNGPARERLAPVFRDRPRRKNDGSLSAKALAALEQAEDLIVLCSPQAAKCANVQAHIDHFKSLGKGDRIHAVLLEGALEDCAPETLRLNSVDPKLAADLRSDKDGWAGGVLKSIAALIGLPLSEIADREIAAARFRARLNAGMAAACGAVALFAGAAAWVAATDVQDLQMRLKRADAGVSEQVSLITDLAAEITEMRQAGSISPDFATELLTRTATTSEKLFAETPDAPRLRKEIARSRQLLAGHFSALGDEEKAKLFAREAELLLAPEPSAVEEASTPQETASAEAAAAPPPPTKTAASATLAALTGSEDGQAASSPADNSSTAKALAILRGLETGDSRGRDRDWRVSVALGELGDAKRADGDLAGAVQAYRRGLSIRRRLARGAGATPERLGGVAEFLAQLGDLARSADDPDRAAKSYAEALEIMRRLAQNQPQETRWAQDTARYLNRNGDLVLARGDVETALSIYKEGLALRKDLAARNRNDSVKARDVGVSHMKIGDAHLAAGHRGWAFNAYAEGLQIAQRLATRNNSDAAWRRDVLIGHVKLAEADPDRARGRYAKALSIAEEMEAVGALASHDRWMLEELQKRLSESKPDDIPVIDQQPGSQDPLQQDSLQTDAQDDLQAPQDVSTEGVSTEGVSSIGPEG